MDGHITERRQTEEVQTAIYRISEVAQTARNLDEMYGLIHGIIGDLMPAQNFYVALYDAATDLLHFPYFTDEFDTPPRPLQPGKSLTGHVLRTGRALLATPHTFEQMVQSGELQLIGAPSVDWLGVPLKTHAGETIGVMVVQTYTESTRFTESDKDVLVFVSTQVAMAVERKRVEERIAALGDLRQKLLGTSSLIEKLKVITDGVVDILDADFARIWMVREADICKRGCPHAAVTEGPDVCRNRTRCLHLMTSSGRYVHIDGGHRRVPLDCYKIGHLATGKESKFINNDISSEPRIHNQEWARSLGLVAFAGHRLVSREGTPIGVLALFRKQAIVPHEESLLEDLASTTSQVIMAGAAEEALRESQRAMSTLLSNLQGMAYRCRSDQQWVMEFVSQGSLTLTGYLPEHLVANARFSYADLIHPEDRAAVWQSVQDAVSGEKPFELFYRINTADGTTKWVWDKGRGIFQSDGALTALEGFVTDITGRKQAEEALRQSEERYRTLFDGMPVGLYRTTSDGRLLNINPALVEILGYPNRESLLATNAADTYGNPEARTQWREQIERDGLIKNYEYQLRRYDGSIIWLEESARVVRDAADRVLYYEGSMVDINKRKRTEEEMHVLQAQLRQSQKIEAVGRLAGGIAHDFNNLLTVIRGYAELSLSGLGKESPLKEDIEGIQKATSRAADLTRQLLAFSRRQVMEMEIVDLNALLIDLDKMLHRVIGEDIEVVTVLAENLGHVKADPGQMEQVIMNLAVNARDAMPAGGKLTIETANVRMDEAYGRKHAVMPSGQYVMLSVSDTGLGMTPEVKERIFEPFFTTKEKGKGTGLGLSTVYGIVKQSGGYIWVYSEPEIGTTFKIYLVRVNEPAAELRERTESNEMLWGNETILVVEDDENVRELARRILKKQGYCVVEASSGEAAINVYRELREPIHLILTDVVMPRMSGRELIDRLQPLRSETRVLYMSGYTDNAIVSKGILQQGIHYIQKPFTMEGLSRTVRATLDRE